MVQNLILINHLGGVDSEPASLLLNLAKLFLTIKILGNLKYKVQEKLLSQSNGLGVLKRLNLTYHLGKCHSQPVLPS